MSSPPPDNVSVGSLDMPLRELLVHMVDGKLDHVVLVPPGIGVHITVTVASVSNTRKITAEVGRILGRRSL